MKPMIETKGMRKGSIAMVFLTMIMVSGYGQGLLLEGAAKLFNSIRYSENVPEYVILHTNYLPAIEKKGAGFSLNTLVNFSEIANKELLEVTNYNEEFYPNIIASFTVSGLDVAYEKEIVTESWMTKPFSNELEESQAIEPWMTNGFYKELEPNIEVEDWMIIPVYDAIEESLEVEEWMTQPLI
ncbi:MAG: hypothetical protein WD577_12485 [Bacteroidales bacterium]